MTGIGGFAHDRADTGEVRGAGLSFTTPAPAPTTVNITFDTAGATAQGTLAQAGIQNPVQGSQQQEVVQPNTLWQAGGDATPQPGVSRIAWVCSYSLGDDTFEVWVDAETGAVIGGQGQGVSRAHTGVHRPQGKLLKKLHHGGATQPLHGGRSIDHEKRTTP